MLSYQTRLLILMHMVMDKVMVMECHSLIAHIGNNKFGNDCKKKERKKIQVMGMGRCS
jgi:hypothetical protein